MNRAVIFAIVSSLCLSVGSAQAAKGAAQTERKEILRRLDKLAIKSNSYSAKNLTFKIGQKDQRARGFLAGYEAAMTRLKESGPIEIKHTSDATFASIVAMPATMKEKTALEFTKFATKMNMSQNGRGITPYFHVGYSEGAKAAIYETWLTAKGVAKGTSERPPSFESAFPGYEE